MDRKETRKNMIELLRKMADLPLPTGANDLTLELAEKIIIKMHQALRLSVSLLEEELE